jgi:HEAT repeat protein
LCLLLAYTIRVGAQTNADAETARDDEKTLKAVGLTEPEKILEYFRKRTFAEADPRELDRLVRRLGADDFSDREEAFRRLAELGAVALSGLKSAESDTNPERRRRVAELKHRVEAKADSAVQSAAARTLARSKPTGAAEVLLAYVTFASDPAVVDEIGKALGAVALRNNKAEPSLLQALQGSAPIKRGLAGEALARAHDAEHLPAVRKLLADPDATVRLRVGLALAAIKEKEAVPVLVDLVGELSADQLWQVEEMLVRLAGEKAPSVSLGTDEAGRKTAHAAWSKWLSEQRGKLNMEDLDKTTPILGYTLLVQQHFNRVVVGGVRRGGSGEVVELDKDRNVKWRFDVQGYPVDAAVVGPDRVLVAEYQTGRVAEYSFKGGEPKWQKAVNGNPIGVQRMPNGNTFIIMQNRLFEIDKQGEIVFDHQRPQHDIMRARKMRNGNVIFVTNIGALNRYDTKTQQTVQLFNVGQMQVLFGNIDLLPNGNILVPEFQASRVVEYDPTGKQVGQISVQWPNSAVRLPNGNTLVASQQARKIIEFNRNGQELWQYQCDGAVFNAHRR